MVDAAGGISVGSGTSVSADLAVAEAKAKEKAKGSSISSSLPDAKGNAVTGNLLSQMPTLEQPKNADVSMVRLSALSSEAIMSMLGFEERKSAVESGLSTIETRRQERAEINEKKIEQLKEQAEKAKSSGILDKIKQAFSYIGMVLGAVAAIGAVIVSGGNPLAIAGAALMITAIADQIVGQATGGEWNISGLLGKMDEALGGSGKTGAIVGQVFSAVLGISGSILSGAGVMKVVGDVNQAARVFQLVSQATTSATQIVGSSVSIASACVNYDIEMSKADQKLLEAILMRIQAAEDLDSSTLEKIMQKSQDMAEGVRAILDDCNQTLGATLTMPTSMA